MRYKRSYSDFWSDREYEVIKYGRVNPSAKYRAIHKIHRTLDALAEVENPEVVTLLAVTRLIEILNKYKSFVEKRFD